MKISGDIIALAVQFEIERWATITQQNIKSIPLPEIPTDDPLIKSALWFNFGMDAGKNLSLAFSQMAKKAALPVWIAFKAQELYAKHYHANKMKNARTMLSAPYNTFQSQLVNAVTDAARMYTVNPLSTYLSVEKTLLRLFKDHNFKNKNDSRGAIRELISRSEVINTNDISNTQIIKKSLNLLGNKIIDIYKGTKEHSFGGTHLLYASNNPKATIPQSSRIVRASCSKPNPVKTPVDYQKIDSSDKVKMAELYANVYLTEVKHIDFIWAMPCYDTTYVRVRSTSEASVKSIILRTHQGTIDNLVKSYKHLYPEGAKTVRAYNG